MYTISTQGGLTVRTGSYHNAVETFMGIAATTSNWVQISSSNPEDTPIMTSRTKNGDIVARLGLRPMARFSKVEWEDLWFDDLVVLMQFIEHHNPPELS